VVWARSRGRKTADVAGGAAARTNPSGAGGADASPGAASGATQSLTGPSLQAARLYGDDVRGYDDSTYGEAMADVYDDWYPFADTDAAVAALGRLADGGPVLELGVGTGRLALPLAAEGLIVHGVDASPRMLERLRSKPGGDAVHTHLGDMAADLPAGPFRLAVIAVNTLFNLVTVEAQQRAFDEVAKRLLPGGRFVVEAFVPGDDRARESVTVRSLAADHVVLNVSVSDPVAQTASGHFVELRDGEPVRLRPFHVRYATPDQLDAMAALAGLVLEARWADWSGTAFTVDSPQHISVYARPVT
jgi:SAM-dependent methyltransferase